MRHGRTFSVTLALLLAGAGLFVLLRPPSGEATANRRAPPPRALAAATTASSPVASSSAATPAAPPTPLGQGVVGEWTGVAPVTLWKMFASGVTTPRDPSRKVPLRLTEARSGVMNVENFTPTEVRGGVLVGTLEGFPGSTVVLSFIGDAQAGVALIPSQHRAFNFRAGDDGILRVTELDTLHAPDCGIGVPTVGPRS